MGRIAYIGLGSNLGNKRDNCLRAVSLIDNVPGCRVEERSRFYKTEPVGTEGQDWYVNGAIALSSEISARDLLENLISIETSMGRRRRKRWESRSIDLDILLFGGDIIKEKDLIIPHPLMHLRRFVLVPLCQLAPNLVHPVLGSTVIELLENIPEEGQEVLPA
jgi:2-amino-4-hydroxy-6-hydroxymethyldihydropteridine diphosphokinase